MSDELRTFVAGCALEADEVFFVCCNGGGHAPIKPSSTAGYGFSKHGPSIRVVDQIRTACTSCGTRIIVNVLEGDPGYLLVGGEGNEQLFGVQGSTSKPPSELSSAEKQAIIRRMKAEGNPGSTGTSPNSS